VCFIVVTYVESIIGSLQTTLLSSYFQGLEVAIDDDDFKMATTRKRRRHSATGEDPRGGGRI